MIGTKLAHYEITSHLGSGGMGDVYRATDLKLGRSVAIKFLSEAFSQDREREARFQHEARVLASLNHPNIAAIHGLEECDGRKFLIMELVDGETLADRIARGPIPIEEALAIAREICEALEAAHEQGIMHRDLKPANVKIRSDGAVKVLDFGLAKVLPRDSATAVPSTAPTLSSPAVTETGVILGSASYMSPEQARGTVVDKRTDIWGFGCVLYEMLTGVRAFDGESVNDVIAGVLRAAPDFGKLPLDTPPVIRKLLQRCLEKDRKERLPDIAMVRLEMKDSHVATPIEQAPRRRMGLVAIAAALGLMLGAAGALFRPRSSSSIPPSPLRVSVKLGADASLSTDGAASAFLSPEGMMLAFIARQTGSNTPQLYIRPLNQLQATPLAGTDDARNAFFSPNGQWIAFFAGGKLKKVSIRGGTPVIVCDAPDDRGGTWTDDDSIVFQGTPLSSGLMRVSSNGGKPEPLTKISGGEVTQRFPQILGGGKAVLYVSHNKTAEFDEANLIVQPLPDGPRKIIQRGGYYGRYLPSGHLLYIHENTLFAAPFDLGKLEATAQPVPVLEHISAGPGSGLAGRAQFAFSQNGTFVYLPGEATTPDKVCIDWLNRDGKTTTLRAIPANWDGVRFAPDGRRVAFADYATNPPEVWIYEWTRDMPTRLTSGGGLQPVWTPDGQRIAFGSPRGEGIDNLYWQRSDGTGGIQRLTESKNPQRPVSWHPRGKFLAFSEVTLQNGPDIMILPIEGDERSGWKPGKPTVFLGTSAIETAPRFSPDGRWIAYASNESGRAEVYVRPFPGPGGKWQVSNREAYLPLWSRTRRELFYEASDRRIMVAAYKVDGDSLRAEKPRPWSETRLALRQRGTRAWDLHPDGERFALSASKNVDTEVKQDSVVFIFNFFDELRRLAPVSK